MSTNQYVAVDYRINSCLVAGNSYRVISPEEEFEANILEEMTDSVRQSVGRCYMKAQLNRSGDELWMVPFHMNDEKLERFLDAVEYSMDRAVDRRAFVVPLDVVSDGESRAYVMRPLNRQASVPMRTFMPNVKSPRWAIALSLLRRVQQLHESGLTSNGLSREQMRVQLETGEVTIWLNETLSQLSDSGKPGYASRHFGFLSIPMATENVCEKEGITITGPMRDIYSAAVSAFYLIMHSHPFVGSEFYRLVHSDYLSSYQNWPRYILEPGTENNLGNQMLSRAIGDQWERTTGKLKELFNGIFLAVTHPDTYWDSKAEYWDVQTWIRALEEDAQHNDNDNSRGDYHFENEMYHLV